MSMRITVEYWNQVKAATGVGGETLELAEGSGAGTLLRQVAQRYGNPLHDLLVAADGALRPSTIVSINGELAPCGAQRDLREGDVVALLLPVAGG
jgi:molybdopterin converting factor small subunit